MSEGMGEVKKYVADLERMGAGVDDKDVSFNGEIVETEKKDLTEKEISEIAREFLEDPVIVKRVEELVRNFIGNRKEEKGEIN